MSRHHEDNAKVGLVLAALGGIGYLLYQGALWLWHYLF